MSPEHGPRPGEEHERWSRVLDELDAMAAGAVDLADDAVAAQLAGWQPPVGLGRLPAHLAPRALEVLDRQAEVLARVRAVVADRRRQARAVAGVPRAHDATAAAYLDVCA